MKHDPVNHPSHYTQGGIECIEAIKAALTEDEFVGFLKGQMLKYTWRSGHKDDIIQDTKKSIWYANYLVHFVQEIRHRENMKAMVSMADCAIQSEPAPEKILCFYYSIKPDPYNVTILICDAWNGPGWYLFATRCGAVSGPYEHYVLEENRVLG